MKYCLGIETTAHTFGCSIVTFDGKILSNVIDSYKTKPGEGGMIPYKVADHHVKVCDTVLKQALEKVNLAMKDIDLISFSQGPGLGNALRIGAFFARCLALIHDKPIVGVNHCIAHLTIGQLLTEAKDPVLLYASGANTQIIGYEGGKFRIFGESLDIGVGNFLDCVARELGLGFPGGPKIQVLAEQGKNYIEIPYCVKGMDVSFGGILTFVKQLIKKGEHSKEDICYSVQETVFAMLLEVSERAMAHCDKTELLLGGGVACNTRLQEMSNIMCKERDAKCYSLENQYNIDNAAMIAWQGILEYNAGKRQDPATDTIINPYWRTDDVIVNWV
ncbi:MAG: KEOPS complex N(6)-L-threonylcarbamoyladenine synthase Kae1 [Nanoarchaeota archaeon]|nr:KEOPS complex N(6)-L-threonylcarbamoyladenine synthase Kae1 [Nanoarchaeota archaeon]